MRLNRLDLIRYGRFKDAQIALPLHTDGTADVTVIFGENEAGKSTAFTGYLELLFGMKPRDHPYTFVFERNDLLIGAELDLPGRGAVTLRRNAKRSQSLLDDHGRPIEEAILSSAMHGVGRDAYVERFSLNDQGLREGGARIVGAGGDLGQLLHAGVSGLTSVADTLDQMEAQAELFHKKGGRGRKLKKGKDRLLEIERELRAARLTRDKDQKLQTERDVAQAVFDTADTALNTARCRQFASDAAQIWYTCTEEIKGIETALTGYPSGPDLALGASVRVAGLVATLADQNNRITEADEKIARHTQAIVDNQMDPLAEALAQEIHHLDRLVYDGAPLIARVTSAGPDLGKRCQKRDDLVRQMDDIMSQLGLSGIAAVNLVLTTDELEILARAVQACAAANNDYASAVASADAARAQLGDPPAQPQDLSALKTASDTWQAVSDLTHLQRSCETLNAGLNKAILELPAHWASLVEAGPATYETLTTQEDYWGRVTAALDLARSELGARDGDLRIARAEREVDENAPSAIDLIATEETRRQRDVLWAEHRSALSAKTSEAFAAAMYADDSARAHFLMGAEARQRLNASRRVEAAALAKSKIAQKRYDELNARYKTLQTRVAATAAGLGLAPDTALASFTRRHTALMHAAGIAADLQCAQDDLALQEARRVTALCDLTEAAQLVGVVATQDELPLQVGRALTLQNSVRATWERWNKQHKGVVAQEEAAGRALLTKQKMTDRLSAKTAALPLMDQTVATVNAALPELRTLQRLHYDHTEIVGRIEALQGAIAAMELGVEKIMSLTNDPDLAGSDPMTVIQTVRNRVATAEKVNKLRGAEGRLKAQEQDAHKRATAQRDKAQTQLDACFDGQGGDALQPLDRIAELAERDRHRMILAQTENQRHKARAGVDATLFSEELAQLPNAARAAEVQQDLDDAQTARDLARDAARETARLYREAFDAAERGDLATERATILEELRIGARRAAVARIGVLAARGALKRLAAERRSDMLIDVGDAFVAMTAPKWSGVDVWGDKLVGLQPDGRDVPVDSMSTGTMGQLYFALRLAGYRSFARQPGPLPMVLDDIMETFDDTRATAALNLCAQIGRSGQAIIFTHHHHLVDLARATIPGVSIVNMPT